MTIPRRDLLKSAPLAALLFGAPAVAAAAAGPIMPTVAVHKELVKREPAKIDPFPHMPGHLHMTDAELRWAALQFLDVFVQHPGERRPTLFQAEIYEMMRYLKHHHGQDEMALFLRRYVRMILGCDGIIAADPLSVMHTNDVLHRQIRENVTSFFPCETYEIRPVTTPTFQADLDKFTDMQSWADYIWKSVSSIRNHVKHGPLRSLVEVDCFVKIETYHIAHFVWIRELVRKPDDEPYTVPSGRPAVDVNEAVMSMRKILARVCDHLQIPIPDSV